MLDRVYNFVNFFDEDERDFVKRNFESHGNWIISGSSVTPNSIINFDEYLSSHRDFWYKELIDNKALTWLFKTKVESFFSKNIEISRFYANGQAHSQSGLFHVDVEPYFEGEYGSLVYYIHDDWKPEYGGHLMIKEEEELISVLPETNSAVIFNSKLPHCALEPTVYCRTQRVSLAFKFRIL